MATVSKPLALDETLQSVNETLEGIKTGIENQNSSYLSKEGGTLFGELKSQNVVPSTTDTYSLGSSSNEYNELFLKYISIGGKRLNGDAGFHNSIFRGKNITSYYTDGSLWNRINGTSGYTLFEDLYVGDYFSTGESTITYSTSTETSKSGGTKTTSTNTKTRYWQIAGFDLRLNIGDTSTISAHHLVIIPCSSNGQSTDILYSSSMYSVTPFSTAYLGSYPSLDLHAAEGDYSEGSVATGVKSIFGSHLLSARELLSVTNNTDGYGRYGSGSGVSNNWAWHTVYGTLLSEVECYGSIVWSSSGYDGGMDSRGQLPLFRLKPSLISTRSYNLWLRSVTTGSYFARVNYDGNAGYYNAFFSFGIRPRFIIS